MILTNPDATFPPAVHDHSGDTVLSLTLSTPMSCAPSIAHNAPVRTPTVPSHSSLFREAMGWQVLEIKDRNTDLESDRCRAARGEKRDRQACADNELIGNRTNRPVPRDGKNWVPGREPPIGANRPWHEAIHLPAPVTWATPARWSRPACSSTGCPTSRSSIRPTRWGPTRWPPAGHPTRVMR